MRGITRRQFAGATGLALAVPGAVVAADLKPETLHGFDEYIRRREHRLNEERLKAGSSRFLWLDDSPQRRDRAKAGEVAIEAAVQNNPRSVPGGLIHDWAAGVFIPSVNLARVLGIVQDYDRHKQLYRPEVIDSKLIRRDGDHFSVYYRLMKKKVITAVLDTEHDVRYFSMGSGRIHSRSYSTKITEVESPGEAGEKELAAGDGHGFLWRLNSYWRFAERDGGVYVECEAVSLTRGIPFGLGWMIEPIIRDLPQESLEKSLGATRNAAKV
ncbi:MAG: hypothetical protein ABI972_24160 [Acidobacteriota bacterium]